MTKCEEIKAALREAGWDAREVTERDGEFWASFDTEKYRNVCLGPADNLLERMEDQHKAFGFHEHRIPTPHWSGFHVGQRVERLYEDDGIEAGLLRAIPECQETERAPEPDCAFCIRCGAACSEGHYMCNACDDGSIAPDPVSECADDDCHAPATDAERVRLADMDELQRMVKPYGIHADGDDLETFRDRVRFVLGTVEHKDPTTLRCDGCHEPSDRMGITYTKDDAKGPHTIRWYCEPCYAAVKTRPHEMGRGIYRTATPIHDDDPNALDALPHWED